MKKIVFFAAFFAALSGFTSCSGDDDLTQPEKPVEELRGTPFSVRVVDGTRADLSKTTTANLSSFKLYGIQQTASKNMWMDGAAFNGGNEAGWTSDPSRLTWPKTSKTTATNFYGYADGSALTAGSEPAGLTPSIENDAQSFTFTFGDGAESAPFSGGYTEAEIANLPARNQAQARTQRSTNITNNTRTTLPLSVQTDLLVTADNTTATEDDNGGQLDLTFNHALSNLVIKAHFVTSDKWTAGQKFSIFWIRIHNLKTSGTYTFGSGWSFKDTDASVIYEKVWGEDSPLVVDIQDASDAAANGIKLTTLVAPGEFMMIPQTFTSWETSGLSGTATPISDAISSGNCYIEMYGHTSAGTGYRGKNKYLPLSVTNGELKAGSQHTIVLNLTAVSYETGIYCASPAEVSGAKEGFFTEE